MTKIQLGSRPSSSSTHRVTRASETLNRHDVGRPSNLAIEEAARISNDESTPSISRPSRLVNLHVHSDDLAQLPPAEPAMHEVVVPRVVELGQPISASAATETFPANLAGIVPPEEAPIEDPINMASVATPITTPAEAQTLSMVPYTDTTMVNQSNIATDPEALAMNIAADYATASLGASMQSLPAGSTISGLGTAEVAGNSVEAIAHAASEAIASIRTATDPEEVAEQVTSLKAFAENIKASSAAPEMMELSDTIEKFVGIAMKSTKVQEEVEKKAAIEEAKAKAAASKAATKKVTPKVSRPTTKKVTSTAAASPRRVMRATPSRPALKRNVRKVTPPLMKDEDQALRKALHSVAAMDGESEEKPTKKRAVARRKTSPKRFALAFFCATACVAAIVYFVGSNIPDISVKVAAMQTGIEASYPAYVPRDFSLSDISSEEGKIVLTFKGPEQANFSLSEEKSSWDSTTLLRNYVEPTWNSNYTTTHEQGITIYISGANAAWVNGGVLYKIESKSSNTLTKKQLRNIVTSL